MSQLLIATGNGQLYQYDTERVNLKTVFINPNPNEWFMGLTKYQDKIMVSSTFGLHLFEWKGSELDCLSSMSNLKVVNPRFGHIRAVGDIVFSAASSSNSIFITGFEGNSKLTTYGRVIIKRTKEKTNFDQIMDISFHDEKFYVLLHELANNPMESRLLEFSSSFELLNYYDFGWNAYGMTVTPEHKYVLCNHNAKTNIGGFVRDTDIMFQWGPDYKMKDMAMTKDSIFIVGHAIVPEKGTTLNGGVILELDYNFNVKDMQMFCGYGQFLGCMIIDEEDLTNNSNQLSSDILNLHSHKEENIEVRINDGAFNDTLS